MGNTFAYEGVPGTHQWYDGTQHPWQFARVWHLEPSLTEPDTTYAGGEDAALFRSTDGGQSWQELSGLREVKGNLWQPGAGGMCLHTILLDPSNPNRIFIGHAHRHQPCNFGKHGVVDALFADEPPQPATDAARTRTTRIARSHSVSAEGGAAGAIAAAWRSCVATIRTACRLTRSSAGAPVRAPPCRGRRAPRG